MSSIIQIAMDFGIADPPVGFCSDRYIILRTTPFTCPRPKRSGCCYRYNVIDRIRNQFYDFDLFCYVNIINLLDKFLNLIFRHIEMNFCEIELIYRAQRIRIVRTEITSDWHNLINNLFDVSFANDVAGFIVYHGSGERKLFYIYYNGYETCHNHPRPVDPNLSGCPEQIPIIDLAGQTLVIKNDVPVFPAKSVKICCPDKTPCRNEEHCQFSLCNECEHTCQNYIFSVHDDKKPMGYVMSDHDTKQITIMMIY